MAHLVFKHTLDGAIKGALLTAIMMAFSLTACSLGASSRAPLAPPPPSFTPGPEKTGMGITIPLKDALRLAKTGRTDPDAQVALRDTDPAVPDGCSLLERFDRSSALSYTSADGRREWALNLETSGASVDSALIRFRYQWGGPKKPSALALSSHPCLYPAQIQGLIGSAYHELIVRDKNTVWQQLRHLKPK